MGITQQLPITGAEFTRQVTAVIALWLTVTFTLALVLTVFLP